MLEISFFCVIVLAAGYWATMFLMGRRDDVIHGKFVNADQGSELARPSTPAPPPPFPKRPAAIANVDPASNAAKPVNSAALQSLLAAIQQDLKSVA